MRNLFVFSLSIFCCLLLAVHLLAPPPLQASEGKAKKKTEKTEKKEKEGKKEGKKEEKKTEKKKEAPAAVVTHPSLEKLWTNAQDMLQLGDIKEAARLLYLVHYYYPADEKSESALWQAANLQKELAQADKVADWDKVLDRFRRFINYYPKSANVAEAYFEIGRTYQAMRYYSEAESYLKIFMKRYPESPLVFQAMRSYRNSMLRAGHQEEAKKVFVEWQQSPDAMVKMMGEAGVGNLKSSQGEYQGALAIYQKIMTQAPEFAVADPEILRYSGIANMRLGNSEIARNQLFHYLTLAGMVAERSDVLLELAESYFTAVDYQSAHKLYRQVIDEGGGNERGVLLSNMRVSQYLDDPEITLAKWQHHNDLSDTDGDKPYLAVLEKLFRDPVAQDARFGLFRRYQARGNLDKAYEVGRNFLRNTEPVEGKAPSKEVRQILLYLIETALQEKKYQQIYDLYAGEYRHIKGFPSAKLQSLVGQALEALNLYEPAAALYYLAMQWPMTDPEKSELYFRRARIYLAAKDYEALDRLLAHLHKIYEGKPEAYEVAKYSAELSAARGQIDQAQKYYGETLSQAAAPEKQAESSEQALTLMVQEGRLGPAETFLATGVEGGWISPAAQQGWLLRIGNGWRLKGDFAKAESAYVNALADGMPEKGKTAQQVHLYLGDVLFAQDDPKQGLAHYQSVLQGDDSLWKKMASERVTQVELDTEMAAMKKGSAE